MEKLLTKPQKSKKLCERKQQRDVSHRDVARARAAESQFCQLFYGKTTTAFIDKLLGLHTHFSRVPALLLQSHQLLRVSRITGRWLLERWLCHSLNRELRVSERVSEVSTRAVTSPERITHPRQTEKLFGLLAWLRRPIVVWHQVSRESFERSDLDLPSRYFDVIHRSVCAAHREVENSPQRNPLNKLYKTGYIKTFTSLF